MTRVVLPLMLLICLQNNPAFAEGSVPLGVKFFSPDRRYSVQLEDIDGLPHYVIKTNKTGEVDNSIVMPTLLLYLHWAANSKSFVAVEHIVKGSLGRVIYRRGNKWTDVEVGPPSEGMMFKAVIYLKLGVDRVHYKFAATRLTDNWKPVDYRFCDLDVSLETGKTFDVQWTPVNDAAFLANLKQNPVYLPPMDYKGPRER